MVLTLAVHPFKLPDQSAALNLELLPPLTTPPMPTVKVQIAPRQAIEPPSRPSPLAPPQAATPEPQAPVQTPPEPLAAPQPAAPPSPPVEVRPSQSVQQPPVEVERRAAQARRLQTQQATPQIPEAPPEPVQANRQAPALQPQIELPRAQTQGRSRPLDTSRAAPQLPQAAAPAAPAPQAAAPVATAPEAAAPPATSPEAAAPAAPSQVQVLTNQNVIQAPVEIQPRARTPIGPRVTAQPGAAEIPSLPAGNPPPAGAPPGGQAGAPSGGGRPQVGDFNGIDGINGGFGSKGMRQALGCEDPDTYKLTREERAACLERFGQRARNAPDLGLPIPTRKQAQYDHYEACQKAYKKASLTGSNDASEGTSIRGLGPNPSLKECGPGER